MTDCTLLTGAVAWVYALLTVETPGTAIDPDADTVEVTFLAAGETDLADAEWTEGAILTSGKEIFAEVLVGAQDDGGDLRLELGDWQPYVRLTHGDQVVPLKPPGLVRVKAS